MNKIGWINFLLTAALLLALVFTMRQKPPVAGTPEYVKGNEIRTVTPGLADTLKRADSFNGRRILRKERKDTLGNNLFSDRISAEGVNLLYEINSNPGFDSLEFNYRLEVISHEIMRTDTVMVFRADTLKSVAGTNEETDYNSFAAGFAAASVTVLIVIILIR